MTDFLFVDSTPPPGLTPGTISSGYLYFLPVLPLCLYTRKTYSYSMLLAATKTKPEAPRLVGSHPVSVPALVPHSQLLSGPTWGLTLQLLSGTVKNGSWRVHFLGLWPPRWSSR